MNRKTGGGRTVEGIRKRRRNNWILMTSAVVMLAVTMGAGYYVDNFQAMPGSGYTWLGWMMLAAGIVCGILLLKIPDSRAVKYMRNIALSIGGFATGFSAVACVVVERMMRFW